MSKRISFNELRRIKDMLPHGSMARIAKEFDTDPDTVRNFFGGQNFKDGNCVGFHIEPGPDGGIVELDDTAFLDAAMPILKEGEEQ